MLRVSMLLGTPLVYPKNHKEPTLRREPRGFNSVIGNLTGHHEFVVYNNSQVNIDYVVYYDITPSTSALFRKNNKGAAAKTAAAVTVVEAVKDIGRPGGLPAVPGTSRVLGKHAYGIADRQTCA